MGKGGRGREKASAKRGQRVWFLVFGFLPNYSRDEREWSERKVFIRQPPIGEKDDYDSENSCISDVLSSSSGQGVGGKISSTPMTKPPEVLRDPPIPPPPHHSKRLYFQFWRKNSDIWRQNSDIWHQNSNMWRQYSQKGPQIQINEFLYHQKPPALCEENSRLRRFDTHPPSHVCKKC